MNYNLINPSDAYTFVSDSFLVAAASVLVLGRGSYGMESEDSTQELPILLLGGSAKFLKKHYGDFDKWLDKPGNLSRIADCLDTVAIVDLSKRDEYDQTMKLLCGEDREKYRAEIHDKNRSSTNDIGAKAWRIAKAIKTGDIKAVD